AYNLDLVAHLLLAALGMFALARKWGQSAPAAAVAGGAWWFGRFPQGPLQELDNGGGGALGARGLLALVPVVGDAAPRSVSLAALVVGLDLLGGHIQIVLYTGLALAAYAVVGVVRRVRADGTRPAIRSSLGLVAAAAGALGVGLVFLWPFVEWTRFI